MSLYLPIVGGGVIKFWLGPANSWIAGGFLGENGSDGSSLVPTDVIAWIVPAPGRVSNLVVLGLVAQVTGARITVSLCKNVRSTSPTYPTTLLGAVVNNSTSYGEDATHGFDVARGDMIVAKCSGLWLGGQSVSAQWVPNDSA